jgi:hypothetical protein
MAGKKKLDVVKLAILAVVVVCLVLVIVGVCITWVTRTSSATLLGTSKTNYLLGDEYLAKADNYGTMVAFAYVTLGLAIVCALVCAASVLLNNKIVNYAALAVGILLIVSAVVSIILSYTFCSGLLNISIGNDASSAAAPAAGAWLVAVFGFVGGAATVVGSLKK